MTSFLSGLLSRPRARRSIAGPLSERFLSSPARPVVLGLGAGVAAGIVTAAVAPWAGFVVVLGLAAILGTMANPRVGLLTIIAILYLLPFAVIPIPIGGLHLTFLDVGLSGVLLVWALRLLARPGERLATSPLDGPILVFIGLALTSFAFGIYSASGEATRFFLKTVNSILFFFTVTNCLRERKQLEQTVRAILWAAFGAAAIALLLYVLPAELTLRSLNSLGRLGYPTGPEVLRYIADTKTLRATGTAIDPNVLGGMLLLAIPLGISQLLGERPVVPRYLAMPMLLTIAIALLLSYSRSSWIGAMAALLFIAVLRYRRVWLILVLALTLLYLIPQGAQFTERFESGVLAEDRAAQMRLGEYKDALRLISLYPWFGVGFGSAPRVDLYVATSSIYLLMAEEMGLVGVAAFLLTVVALLWHVFDSSRRVGDPSLSALQIGALAGVVGALSAGIFDHYFFNLQFPHTAALFWLFVGLAVVATRLRIAESMPQEDERKPSPVHASA